MVRTIRKDGASSYKLQSSGGTCTINFFSTFFHILLSFPPFLFFFPSNSSLFYCLSFPCSFLLSLMNSVFLLIGKVISQHKDDLLSMLDHFNIQVCMSGKVIIVLLMLVNIL